MNQSLTVTKAVCVYENHKCINFRTITKLMYELRVQEKVTFSILTDFSSAQIIAPTPVL